MSPFFLDHSYNIEPFALTKEILANSRNQTPKQKAKQITQKLKDALDVAASELTANQEQMEKYTNERLDPAP
jgi:hypothetical protein